MQFGCGSFRRRKFSYDELPEGIVLNSKGFRLETPLPDMLYFLKALNFSLCVHFHLVIWLVKNEALEQSFKSNSWHLTCFMLLLVLVTQLRAV